MTTPVYLDNSATTRVREEVVEAMLPYLSESFGNPSSIHRLGRSAQLAIAEARQRVAALLNCQAEEVYFTPCGTYSNNVAILGRVRFAEANGQGRHLITSAVEHSAVMGPAKHVESLGWRVTYLPVDREGFVDPDQLRKVIAHDTSIISIMWANNEVGTLEPIQEMAQIASEAGVYFHTDAVQVTGKIATDLARVPVSTLSLSGHKFHAPKGIGVLFVRKGINLMPLVFGGGQERGLFPGTEALASIVAVGKAAELASVELDANLVHLRRMQEILSGKLAGQDGVKFTGPKDPARRLPGHVSFVVSQVEGEAVVMKSDLKGVCLSSGSACHQGIMEPSHVLTALGVPKSEALGSVRISAGRFNTEAECKRAAEIIREVLTSCRQAQPSGIFS